MGQDCNPDRQIYMGRIARIGILSLVAGAMLLLAARRTTVVWSSLPISVHVRAVVAAPRRRARVRAAFLAEADRPAAGRAALAAPPIRPPFCAGFRLIGWPRPEPPFLPPPVMSLTVAQARRFASFWDAPR